MNKLPKGLQKKARQHLHDIWMDETRNEAESAFDFFLQAYGAKYDKAVACLAKDRDVLCDVGRRKTYEVNSFGVTPFYSRLNFLND